jgi:hypothetical protein
MSVPNMLSLTLKHSKLEIRSGIIAQLIFRKQFLSLEALTRGLYHKTLRIRKLRIRSYGKKSVATGN